MTTCTKRPFKRRKLAASAASTVSAREGEPYRAYHCKVEGCHAWHIGHPPGWRVTSQQGREVAHSIGGARTPAYEAVPDGQGGLTVQPAGTWRRDG